MAGVKGRSGGARPNSGGARPGAGRPRKNAPKPAQDKAYGDERAAPVPCDETDMLEFLRKVAMGHIEATALQVRAAIAAVQYTHTKRHEGGKKEERDDAARKVAGGKFSAAAPPKLVVSNK